jgi:hypothetical protein
MSGIEPRPELFDEVAGQLERGEEPMNLQWVQERHVTHDELVALSGRIALILRGYTALHPADRIAFVTRGVLRDKPAESQG